MFLRPSCGSCFFLLFSLHSLSVHQTLPRTENWSLCLEMNWSSNSTCFRPALAVHFRFLVLLRVLPSRAIVELGCLCKVIVRPIYLWYSPGTMSVFRSVLSTFSTRVEIHVFPLVLKNRGKCVLTHVDLFAVPRKFIWCSEKLLPCNRLLCFERDRCHVTPKNVRRPKPPLPSRLARRQMHFRS